MKLSTLLLIVHPINPLPLAILPSLGSPTFDHSVPRLDAAGAGGSGGGGANHLLV